MEKMLLGSEKAAKEFRRQGEINGARISNFHRLFILRIIKQLKITSLYFLFHFLLLARLK